MHVHTEAIHDTLQNISWIFRSMHADNFIINVSSNSMAGKFLSEHVAVKQVEGKMFRP